MKRLVTMLKRTRAGSNIKKREAEGDRRAEPHRRLQGCSGAGASRFDADRGEGQSDRRSVAQWWSLSGSFYSWLLLLFAVRTMLAKMPSLRRGEQKRAGAEHCKEKVSVNTTD